MRRLAWDEVRGESVYAYLAPAVRAFFRNGGRRCWIIRVAAQARSNHFPITGVMHIDFDDSGPMADVKPAFAQARSEGRLVRRAARERFTAEPHRRVEHRLARSAGVRCDVEHTG